MTPKYLRQTTTGRIYAYTKVLGIREDMVPYDGPVPVPQANPETPEKTPVPGAADVGPGPDENPKAPAAAEGEGTDPNKITALVTAIESLVQDEDFTSSGSPKVESLAKIIGLPVTGKERDEAWAEFLKKKAE